MNAKKVDGQERSGRTASNGRERRHTLVVGILGGLIGGILALGGSGWLFFKSPPSIRNFLHSQLLASDEAAEALAVKWNEHAKKHLLQFSNELSTRLTASETKLLKELNTLTTGYEKDREERVKRLEEAVAKRWDEALAVNLKAFRAATSRGGTIETAEEKKRHQYAVDAIRLAEEARKEGNRELCQLFLFSALGHAPDDMEILKQCVDYSLQGESVSVSELNRTKSVLELAVYEMAPADARSILALRDRVDAKIQSATSGITPTDIAAEWTAISSEKLDSIALDTRKLGLRLGRITELTARAEAEEHPLLGNLAEAERTTNQAMEAAKFCELFDVSLQNYRALAAQTNWTAVDQVQQTLQAQLLRIGLIPLASLPATSHHKIKLYPTYVETAELRYKPLVDDAKASVDRWRGKVAGLNISSEPTSPKGAAQSLLEEVSADYERIEKSLRGVGDVAVADELRERLAELSRVASDLRRKQADAYQRWATVKLDNAFEDWYKNKNITKTPQWDKTRHAETMLKKWTLEQINSALLMPETSRVYNDVTGQMLQECWPDQAVKLQRFIAEENHRSYENF
jgi:hypothetical protein